MYLASKEDGVSLYPEEVATTILRMADTNNDQLISLDE